MFYAIFWLQFVLRYAAQHCRYALPFLRTHLPFEGSVFLEQADGFKNRKGGSRDLTAWGYREVSPRKRSIEFSRLPSAR